MRHDAQLDLRVVGRDDFAARLGHEGLAHATPLGGAHGNVLKIGVGTCQAPRHRRGLPEGRVHTSVGLVGHLRQFVGVGALEFAQSPEFENELGQRIVEGKLREHLLVGRGRARGGLFLDGKPELFKEHLRELLGAGRVKGAARDRFDLGLDLVDARGQLRALLRELVAVNQNARALHARQNPHHRQFELAVDTLQGLVLGQLDGHDGGGGAQQRCGAATESGRLVDADVGGVAPRGALAEEGLVIVGAHGGRAGRQFGKVVPQMRFEHVAHKHGVVHGAGHGQTRIGEHVQAVFGVVEKLGGR